MRETNVQTLSYLKRLKKNAHKLFFTVDTLTFRQTYTT